MFEQVVFDPNIRSNVDSVKKSGYYQVSNANMYWIIGGALFMFAAYMIITN